MSGSEPRAFDVLEEADTLAELERLRPDDPTLLEIEEQTTYGEILLEDLVRRQLVLAISVAAVFLAILFSLPLLDRVLPEVAAARVFGLPLRWFALAVLVYPLLWLLAGYYVSTSKKYEDDFTETMR